MSPRPDRAVEFATRATHSNWEAGEVYRDAACRTSLPPRLRDHDRNVLPMTSKGLECRLNRGIPLGRGRHPIGWSHANRDLPGVNPGLLAPPVDERKSFLHGGEGFRCGGER